MLTVISPAKTLNFDSQVVGFGYTEAEYLDAAAELVDDARTLSKTKIASLMGVSAKIADLNYQRFQEWEPASSIPKAKQAIFAFKGDVYSGLAAEDLAPDIINFAQDHLRILSGLYGVLRPLDLMQPYRLEMGLKLSNRGGKDLYSFWGDRITNSLNNTLKASESRTLVNLASNEYFKSINQNLLEAEVVTPIFKDLRGGSYKIISFYAKKARGQMARYIASKKINDPKKLKNFSEAGYRFSGAESNDTEMYFFRDDVPTK